MQAAEFQAIFARQFACTVDVASGREFTAAARASSAQGLACVECGRCARDHGEVGLAADGVAIVHDAVSQRLKLRWACPGCGCDVHEDIAGALEAAAHAAAVLADPLCGECRKQRR